MSRFALPGVACAAALLYVAGCSAGSDSSFTASTPTPGMGPGDLRFEDPEMGRRMTALDRCVREIADSSWEHVPYQIHGNFLDAHWCRGAGAGATASCGVRPPSGEELDQHAVELYTLSYEPDFSEVFGLGVRAVWVPEAPGWGASFYYAEDGRTVVGDGLRIEFILYPREHLGPAVGVLLGSRYEYSIDETTVDLESDLPVRDDLSAYLASPEALRDRGMAMMDALLARVEEAVQAHQVPKCVYGTYQGGGLPPLCTPQPMSRGEEVGELAAARAYFASQKQLLGDHYPEMYAALMQAFPLDRCRP